MQFGKKKFTIGFLSTLLCLMAMLVAACGGGNGGGTGNGTAPQKAPASKQVYNWPNEVADIGTFDPAQASDVPSSWAIDTVFTGMVQLDNNLQVKPQMATWQESADHMSWTFRLKPNLKFSDGTPLTSHDVAYSIDRALQPALKSPVAYYLGLIKDSDQLQAGKIKTIIGDSVLTPDDSTVVIKTNQPAAYFLYTMTYPTSFVVEKSLIDKYGQKNWTDHLSDNGGMGGDGPFKVQSYDHAKGITVVPNPNYYGAKPQLQKIFFAFGNVVATTYKDYQVGQVDVTPVPTTNLAQAKQKTNEFSQTPNLDIDYITMNYLAKPFDSIAMRQAFYLALNRSAIMEATYKGTRPATNHIIPTGMPGTNPNITAPDGSKSTTGNADKARQLFQQGLKDEGYSSASQLPPIKLTYETGSTDFDNEMAAIIQQWQSVLGVSVKPDPIDFEKLVTEENATLNNPKGLQMWALGWVADYPDPQDWTSLLFGKGSSYNLANYGSNTAFPSVAQKQQAVQQQMAQADVDSNSTSRYQTYMNVEQQLINDAAWIPIDQRTVTRLTKPYVIGIQHNAADTFPPDMWGNVYIATH